MSIKALERHLRPLAPFLMMEDVTEVCINQPQQVFIEKQGKFISYDVPELTLSLLETLAALVAEYNHQVFPAPLIAGSLLNGERIQIVMAPGCETGKWVASIRRHVLRDRCLDDYEQEGVFASAQENELGEVKNNLYYLYQERHYLALLQTAIRERKNILISGGTGTGKTTFLNACLKEIPKAERLITVEDTREVKSNHANTVHLLFNEDDPKLTSLAIFKACLRLRPDRILLSELRGAEVWPYLRAANSGHPGSLSTVHADSPEGAITQLVFMMQQAGSTSSEEQIRNYIQSIVHVIVQLKRDTRPGRFMSISEIWYKN